MISKITFFSFSLLLIALVWFANVRRNVKVLLSDQFEQSSCPVFDSIAPPSFHADNSTLLKILYDEDFRLRSVSHLANAIKVDTQISDDTPDVPDAPERWTQFIGFHEYLEKQFPQVYENLDVYKVNTYGLVFHWKGTKPELKPLLLTAHQDVVPVQKDTLSYWSYPPFEGHYDGTFVYGRGASDCKNSLTAIFDAVDLLITQNFSPQRGLLIALGFDEEASGVHGARNIGKFLEEKFGKDSVYAIIDEGAGLMKDTITGTIVASPATGEKGYFDIKTSLRMTGGHSSVPPDHGAIGIMGELAYNIEQDPYSPMLIKENPIFSYLQCLAINHGDRMSEQQKTAILRAGYDKVANSMVVKAISGNRATKFLIRTSQAIDLIFGGEKVNALPEDVTLMVNHRIAVGTTVAEIKKHFTSRVIKLAQKYSMTVEAFGEVAYEPESSNGKFTVDTLVTELEYAPVSPSSGKIWQLLAATTRHVFEDVVFKDKIDYPIITVPSLMPANTDTRHYWGLTKHIYRYTPMLVDLLENNIHSVDEKIRVDGHLQLTAWYYEYIQNVSDEILE